VTARANRKRREKAHKQRNRIRATRRRAGMDDSQATMPTLCEWAKSPRARASMDRVRLAIQFLIPVYPLSEMFLGDDDEATP
jgi:hypothetical protein